MERIEAQEPVKNKSKHDGRAETAVADIEGRLAKAERFARLGHWEWDFVSGTGVCSKGLLGIFEFDEDEAANGWESFLSKIHPDDRPAIDLASKELIISGKRTVYDYRLVLRDGSLRDVHSESEVTRNEKGRTIRLFGIAQDVTELRQAERREKERNAELESVFQALPDLYFRIAADGTILDYRANQTSDLYVTPDQFLGKRMQDVLPPDVGPISQRTKPGPGVSDVLAGATGQPPMISASEVSGVHISLSSIRFLIIVTASTGKPPMAVSDASTSPSAPINNVLTTSLTSARVGDFRVTMDSSRLVATKTGVLRERAKEMMRR